MVTTTEKDVKSEGNLSGNNPNSTPEHAKALVKYPTPLWMIEHDPKGAGNFETFWVAWKNVALLLDNYLPGTLVDSEVIQTTEDEVSHVKVTLTRVNADGTIAKRVSAISGQRNTTKSGSRDAFAEAKAQSYAFKNAAVMLGICADMDIILSNPTVKNEIRHGKHRHQANSQAKVNAPRDSLPTTGGSAQSKAATQQRNAPNGRAGSAQKPKDGQTESKINPTQAADPLANMRKHLLELADKIGISEESARQRIYDHEGVSLEELNEEQIDHYVNLSLTRLATQKAS